MSFKKLKKEREKEKEMVLRRQNIYGIMGRNRKHNKILIERQMPKPVFKVPKETKNENGDLKLNEIGRANTQNIKNGDKEMKLNSKKLAFEMSSKGRLIKRTRGKYEKT